MVLVDIPNSRPASVIVIRLPDVLEGSVTIWNPEGNIVARHLMLDCEIGIIFAVSTLKVKSMCTR